MPARAPRLQPCYRTALAVLVPLEHRRSIDAIRARHDKGYPRWMSHVTLSFPFLPFNGLDGAAVRIDAALADAARRGKGPTHFDMALNHVTHGFVDPSSGTTSSTEQAQPNRRVRSSNVCYLQPECSDSGASLRSLSEMSYDCFPELLRTRREHFVPHVTVGQLSAQNLNPFLADANQSWTPVTFPVKEFNIIAHYDGRPGYEVTHTFELPP